MPTTNADTQATGTIAVTGTAAASYATLRVEGARAITLVGDLESELRRLSGATVRVTGRDAGAGPLGRRLDVQRYEVLAIDGQTPVVGTLRVHDDAVWLVAADSVALEAVPAELRAEDGAKVWVTGRRTERGLEVQRYGVLRPAR
ncbi:MAG TPA: hypothetical protein VFJ96_01820 [Gemmatimonadaceae bacterium]|nr:hypothetical protein [Gemmatimonadaceae bacterium]